ncbi:hypothetical protein CPSG_01794 [Coccidioides posadasii str. Silveira]|uniref:Uncharacterized protein n=2 Tax=Coccidioides posadasii TaxID=199306 RepID=E9CWG1_COCPS|nr:hypothetical protein CPSG_01794 [Coccidioides posadasii str. Silveira]KMM65110.1 hypothetical protein CPAG_01462 [Coccidioides posadasii RMSCC 3488]
MVAKSQMSILADNTLPTSAGSSASSTVSKPIKGATKPCFGCGCGDEHKVLLLHPAPFTILNVRVDVGRLAVLHRRSAAGAGGWLKWILSPPEAQPAKQLAMRGKK